jgi:hypothetical protein
MSQALVLRRLSAPSGVIAHILRIGYSVSFGYSFSWRGKPITRNTMSVHISPANRPVSTVGDYTILLVFS